MSGDGGQGRAGEHHRRAGLRHRLLEHGRGDGLRRLRGRRERLGRRRPHSGPVQRQLGVPQRFPRQHRGERHRLRGRHTNPDGGHPDRTRRRRGEGDRRGPGHRRRVALRRPTSPPCGASSPPPTPPAGTTGSSSRPPAPVARSTRTPTRHRTRSSSIPPAPSAVDAVAIGDDVQVQGPDQRVLRPHRDHPGRCGRRDRPRDRHGHRGRCRLAGNRRAARIPGVHAVSAHRRLHGDEHVLHQPVRRGRPCGRQHSADPAHRRRPRRTRQPRPRSSPTMLPAQSFSTTAQAPNFLSAANIGQTPPYVSLTEPGAGRVSRSTFTDTVIVDYRNNAWKLSPTAQVTPGGPLAAPATFKNNRAAAPDAAAIGEYGEPDITDRVVQRAELLHHARRRRRRLHRRSTIATGNADRRRQLPGQRSPRCVGRGQPRSVSRPRSSPRSTGWTPTWSACPRSRTPPSSAGTPDAALATLVDALNAAAGAGTWAFVPSSADLPPVDADGRHHQRDHLPAGRRSPGPVTRTRWAPRARRAQAVRQRPRADLAGLHATRRRAVPVRDEPLQVQGLRRPVARRRGLG